MFLNHKNYASQVIFGDSFTAQLHNERCRAAMAATRAPFIVAPATFVVTRRGVLSEAEAIEPDDIAEINEVDSEGGRFFLSAREVWERLLAEGKVLSRERSFG